MGLHMCLLLFKNRATALEKAVIGALCLALLSGCGNNSRTMTSGNPVQQPGGNAPGADTMQSAIILSANATSTGTTSQLNVSGDLRSMNIVGAIKHVGINPVHAAIIGTDVVVANQDSGTLSVYPVTAGSNAPVQTVMLPSTIPNVADAQPVFVASTDKSNVYVAQRGRNSVEVVSLSTLSAIKEINDFSISGPDSIVQLPNGGDIYVANQGSNLVTVIDPVTLNVKTRVSVGSIPSSVVASSDGNCVYVADQGTNDVVVIRTSDHVVRGRIGVGVGPTFLLFDPKLQRVYAVNTSGNSISIINHAADCSASSSTLVMVGINPQSITALSDGTRAYVASIDGVVTVINTSDNTVRKSIPVAVVVPGINPKVSIGSSADGTRVYVTSNGNPNLLDFPANFSPGSIAVIGTSDDSVVFQLNSASTPPAPSLPGAPTPQFVLMNP